jgi:hypothetical protein
MGRIKKPYPDIEKARAGVANAYVAAGNLFTMQEKLRRAFDECIAIEAAGKLTSEDVGRCNFCAALLGQKRQFTTASARRPRRKPLSNDRFPVLPPAE